MLVDFVGQLKRKYLATAFSSLNGSPTSYTTAAVAGGPLAVPQCFSDSPQSLSGQSRFPTVASQRLIPPRSLSALSASAPWSITAPQRPDSVPQSPSTRLGPSFSSSRLSPPLPPSAPQSAPPRLGSSAPHRPPLTALPSQNHSIVIAGRDPWRSSSPTPLPRHSHPEQVTQEHVQDHFPVQLGMEQHRKQTHHFKHVSKKVLRDGK
ncbi:vegetative cell wall protein gp1-like [Cyanistes caeruleus]|uniref:vegetative cell wall protein gp1-like n=1 Tax=Cyanistes caeruleus TaxID=156563 RepID=UPI000CDABDF2|nr:vegetative cell wall protein gp1-like [Cyanistes caeruleus]